MSSDLPRPLPSGRSTVDGNFAAVCRPEDNKGEFTGLLSQMSRVSSDMHFQFASPRPGSFPSRLLCLVHSHSGVYGRVRLPTRDKDSAILRHVQHNCAQRTCLSLITRVQDVLPGMSLSDSFVSKFYKRSRRSRLRAMRLVRTIKFSVTCVFTCDVQREAVTRQHCTSSILRRVGRGQLTRIVSAFCGRLARGIGLSVNHHRLMLMRKPDGGSRLSLYKGASKKQVLIFPGYRITSPVLKAQHAPRLNRCIRIRVMHYRNTAPINLPVLFGSVANFTRVGSRSEYGLISR